MDSRKQPDTSWAHERQHASGAMGERHRDRFPPIGSGGPLGECSPPKSSRRSRAAHRPGRRRPGRPAAAAHGCRSVAAGRTAQAFLVEAMKRNGRFAWTISSCFVWTGLSAALLPSGRRCSQPSHRSRGRSRPRRSCPPPPTRPAAGSAAEAAGSRPHGDHYAAHGCGGRGARGGCGGRRCSRAGAGCCGGGSPCCCSGAGRRQQGRRRRQPSLLAWRLRRRRPGGRYRWHHEAQQATSVVAAAAPTYMAGFSRFP